MLKSVPCTQVKKWESYTADGGTKPRLEWRRGDALKECACRENERRTVHNPRSGSSLLQGQEKGKAKEWGV